MTIIASLLGGLAATELLPRSRWMDLISGITQTSRDVISMLMKLSFYDHSV
jgi:hypothetical protein